MKPRIQQFQYLFQGDRTFIPSKALIVYPICSRRAVHTSGPKNASAASSHSAILSAPSTQPTAQQHVARNQPTKGVDSPLSILPTSQIVRTYLITRLSSSPTLLNLTFSILNRLLSSKSALTSIDRNPFINWLLKRTFYAQFCAGENKAEVQRTVARMRNVGYNGVILEYALEWLQEKNKPGPDSPITKKEIATWRKGMLETVEMAREGDFVGLKYAL